MTIGNFTAILLNISAQQKYEIIHVKDSKFATTAQNPLTQYTQGLAGTEDLGQYCS